MKKIFLFFILPIYTNAQEPGKVYSMIHTIEIKSQKIDTLWQGQAHFEAPNWSKDGSHLLLNRDGKIYAKSVHRKDDFKELNTGFADRCNNDHGISPDGKWLAISHSPVVGSSNGKPIRKSVVYVVPIEGGTPRRITAGSPQDPHLIGMAGVPIAKHWPIVQKGMGSMMYIRSRSKGVKKSG